MAKLFLVALAILGLSLVACGQREVAVRAVTTPPVPVTTPSARPPAGWEIYISQYGQFAIWHPPGWVAREAHGDHRSIHLTLTPPRTSSGFVLERKFAALDGDRQGLPNVYCHKVRLSGSFTGTHCADTMSGVVVTTLTDTPQGNFTFQASRRSGVFRQYEQILASFKLLRGAA
ncbi:MAG: hypothetical protein JWQ95_3733 [Sphaerisporangium sp.]|nr:hypothetical protein [Sphaerisporangium sp.]